MGRAVGREERRASIVGEEGWEPSVVREWGEGLVLCFEGK